MKITAMKCMLCNAEFTPAADRYVCDHCGTDGILDILYDYPKMPDYSNRLKSKQLNTLWRYRELLPLNPDTPISPLEVGMTPLYRSKNLENKFGIQKVYIKDDGRNPTASLKDRASAVGVSKAIEAKADIICAASTGNAAASLAGFAASLGLKTFIFVPKRAPKAKIAQLLVYGANTIIIDDSYDKAFELSVEATKRFGFYNRNCAYNPYLVEGKKTVAYELWEQNGYKVPDRIYVSIGDGCITSAVYKGFFDLKAIGATEKMPRIIGVQAAGCNPVEIAFKTGKFTPMSGNTIADSIAVGMPRNRLKALRALKESHGDCISVSDDEIKAALLELPRTTAVFGEPAAVTAFAGFLKDAAANKISPDETVAVLITGNGLKDIESAIGSCKIPEPIQPTIQAVEHAVKSSL